MANVIVLTGGSSGIGAAAVARFLAAGAEVWNLDRQAPQHAEVRHLDCDLSDPRAIDNAIKQVNQQMNRVRDNRSMPDAQKRVIMDRLDERKQALIARGNEMLKDY